MTGRQSDISRRMFVLTASGFGLGILDGPTPGVAHANKSGGSFSAYLTIHPNNRVVVQVPGAELGQGVYTSLPKILAEELEADFDDLIIELAPGDEVYANPAKGRQSTGFSDAVMGYTPVLRHAGAAAKEMLIAAAAARWKVSVIQCRAKNSFIFHDASGRSLTFGNVAAEASRLPLPDRPVLKSRDQFTLIGQPTRRKDTPSKVDGSALYGADIKLPGMKYAAVRGCPVYGGIIASFDDAQTHARDGVAACVRLTDRDGNANAVGVIADSYWTAQTVADDLNIAWDAAEFDTFNSDALWRDMSAKLDDNAAAKVMDFANGRVGDADAAYIDATRRYSVDYQVPYLAHACMEPMAATCLVTQDSVDLWAPTQQQSYSRRLAADLTGFPLENVTLHTTFAGGGFGRKWELDFTRQAVELAQAVPGTPVRMIWSREEDIRHDYFRPGYAVRIKTGFDADDRLTSLSVRLVGQSLLGYQRRSPKPPMPDATVVVGAINPIYAIPNTLIDHVELDLPIPIGFWRSVGWSHNGFIAESSIDEAAAWAGRNPIEFRRSLMSGKARELAVLDAIEKLSGWGRALPTGHGMGIAINTGFEAVTAQVAHVSVIDNQVRVHKVWCVYDAGLVIDPLNVEAQIESGIVYGLTAALYGEITFENGIAQQGNFDTYDMLRLATMPEIEVQVMETGDKPGGAGEASVPGIAPAVTNAIFAAVGTRIRRLPLRAAGFDIV